MVCFEWMLIPGAWFPGRSAYIGLPPWAMEKCTALTLLGRTIPSRPTNQTQPNRNENVRLTVLLGDAKLKKFGLRNGCSAANATLNPIQECMLKVSQSGFEPCPFYSCYRSVFLVVRPILYLTWLIIRALRGSYDPTRGWVQEISKSHGPGRGRVEAGDFERIKGGVGSVARLFLSPTT